VKKRAAALAAVLLAAAALVLAPAILLFPFRAQSPGSVALAYELRRANPVLTFVLLAVAAPLVVSIWRASRLKRARIPAVIALAVTCGFAYLARQNHFEWMFRPLERPRLVEASAAKGLDPCDMVLVVQIGDEARAYPVRFLALHHVVNDVVAGEPIVATY